LGLKGISALGVPARIVPDYSFHYNGEGANAALIVSNRFASHRLATGRLFRNTNTNTNTNTKYTCDTVQTRNKLLAQWVHRNDTDVRSDYRNAVAV
jgi:hypothetical protein